MTTIVIFVLIAIALSGLAWSLHLNKSKVSFLVGLLALGANLFAIALIIWYYYNTH